MAKQRKWSGLGVRSFARGVRWKVDQDYLDKLSPEEAQWLHKFNDLHYNGKYDHDFPLEVIRAANREKDAARRDMYDPTLIGANEGPAGDMSDEGRDLNPTPGYQSSAAYKALLARYRANLDAYRDRRKSRNVDTPPLEDYADEDKDRFPFGR